MQKRKTKTVKNYCYEGLGFPVIIKKVTMLEYDGELLPQIHVKKIAHEVIKMLCLSNERLTGAQLLFIRQFLGLTTREFSAKVLGSTTSSNISKWEAKKQQPTKMEPGTELVIRLYVIESVIEAKKKSHAKFFDLYQKARSFLTSTAKPQVLYLDEALL